jgi:hypothetical protein
MFEISVTLVVGLSADFREVTSRQEGGNAKQAWAIENS